VTFDCNGDVHWAEHLNDVNTEWLTAAHPEEKVKGERCSLSSIEGRALRIPSEGA